MKSDLRDWADARSILCVRPDNLGDVLMTTPAIRALKESAPDRRITLLASRAGASIARLIPEIDDIIVFDPPWYKHDRHDGHYVLDHIVAELRARQFDAAVIFTVFSQNPLPSAMLCYMAGIPRVAGYCRENPYALMSHWLPDEEPLYGARHEVQRQLDLATALGATPSSVTLSLAPPHESERLHELLRDAGINEDGPWILLHPGASEARRCYPPALFVETVQRLYADLNVQVVLTGNETERRLAESIAAAAGEGVVSVAGQLEIDSMVSLVAMAPLVVSNNTGPVHIAAAVQTPVVVLYALTNPQHTPWHVLHRVLPFDVPEDERSRNVMVRYAAERYFTESRGFPTPADIVDAVSELLNISPVGTHLPNSAGTGPSPDPLRAPA